jgi:hypothetical protein
MYRGVRLVIVTLLVIEGGVRMVLTQYGRSLVQNPHTETALLLYIFPVPIQHTNYSQEMKSFLVFNAVF